MIFTSLRTRKPVEVPDELVKVRTGSRPNGKPFYQFYAVYEGEKFSRFTTESNYITFTLARIGAETRRADEEFAKAKVRAIHRESFQPVAQSYEVPISFAPELQFASKPRFSDFLDDDSPKAVEAGEPREVWPPALIVCFGLAFLLVVAALVYIGVKKP